jgi:hypothetical protein
LNANPSQCRPAAHGTDAGRKACPECTPQSSFEERLACPNCQPLGAIECPKHWMTVPHDEACTAVPGTWDTQCLRCETGRRKFEREMTYAALGVSVPEEALLQDDPLWIETAVDGHDPAVIRPDDPRLAGGNRWLERDAFSTRRAIVNEDGWEVGMFDPMSGMEKPLFDIPVDPTYWFDPADDEETILEEAQRLVSGPRQSQYNHPSQDFKTTGRQWGALLDNWLKSEGMVVCNEQFPDIKGDFPDVPPRLVALMMVNLKLSREAHKPSRDNRVDGAGYLMCSDMIVESTDE